MGTLSLSSQSCVAGQLLLAAVPLSLKESGSGTPRQSRNVTSWIPVIGALQFSGRVSYVSLTVDSKPDNLRAGWGRGLVLARVLRSALPS